MSARIISAVAVAAGLLMPLAAQAQIGMVTVTAPHHVAGRCPAHIRFVGRIEVDRYPMVLNYVWERSDGARSKHHVVRVSSPNTRFISVSETWRLGARGEHIRVWERLRVRTGNTDITSNAAEVTVDCR